ncbi:MAG: iron ABC transporter permease [Planctomycetes bacterium]|nr:iron ABC transporter permease [Planctomycetota bacterium]
MRSRSHVVVAGTMAGLLLVLLVASLGVGPGDSLDFVTAMRGARSLVGLGSELEPLLQATLELRLWRVLTAAGVGAALALSGALLQGVFRNALASPGVIGVSSGASLGAALAILALGGGAAMSLGAGGGRFAPLFIMLSAFLGSAVAVTIVVMLAAHRGRVSMPALLLTGIAINACCGGLQAAIMSFSLGDYQLLRAIFAWTFGTLDDKAALHVMVVWGALALGVLVIPFVATELDLLAGGEDDARGLGVRTGRTRALAVGAAAFVAAAAVAVAGQIAFVGLIVPHLLRGLFGRGHRQLLPLCVLGGALFLVGAEFLQLVTVGRSALKPGTFMSLVGGPFFIVLLLRQRREFRTW